jgi:GNAT superfamily N-acetyltransferase
MRLTGNESAVMEPIHPFVALKAAIEVTGRIVQILLIFLSYLLLETVRLCIDIGRRQIGGIKLKIDFAIESDYEYIRRRDHHISESLILTKIKGNEIYLLRNQNESNIGWMRYGFFWDNTPFMNMIWVDEEYRGSGAGKQVVLFWEDQMKQRGYKSVMTSTQADEGAQHFYRKLGYKDAGCLILDSQPLEIILYKKLN